ncbi:hypothetical protein HMF3257_16330 [Spirosoma telluris]|uniref:Uncharacterized protein n=1 Tax=Spirosoma telluris TaxID=2183553 RepID=A0A327NKN0_9BACT|nr:hypothetical protein HMF3257_16330 [Spirosoma telluris]
MLIELGAIVRPDQVWVRYHTSLLRVETGLIRTKVVSTLVNSFKSGLLNGPLVNEPFQGAARDQNLPTPQVNPAIVGIAPQVKHILWIKVVYNIFACYEILHTYLLSKSTTIQVDG